MENLESFYSYNVIKSDALSHKDCYLFHAVNCKGVMGAGIAKHIKEKHPHVYEDYNQTCLQYDEGCLGLSLTSLGTDNVQVVNLFTSVGFGEQKCSRKEILQHTKTALFNAFGDMFLSNLFIKPIKIVSNKFNSGLFDVPWEQTEVLLKWCIENSLDTLFTKFPNLPHDFAKDGKKILTWDVCEL